MASNERIRKYLDAGTVIGQVSRGRAEEIVRELVNAGDIQRNQAQEWVDNLVERSRKSSEQVLELVRHEVASQLHRIDAKSLEAIASQVADILKKSAEAGRSATKDVTAQASKTAQGVRSQAGKTATRARTAATKVTPPRSSSGKKTSGPQLRPDLGHRPQELVPQELQEVGQGEVGQGQVGQGQEGRQLSSGARRRLDTELVRRGLVPTRQEAQAAIASGARPGLRCPGGKGGPPRRPRRAGRAARAPSPFVSRGGLKLDGCADPIPTFPWRAGGHSMRVRPPAASPTACSSSGAGHVYAVDVGHGQLHPSLRNDPRVTVLEHTNARTLTLAELRAADPGYEPCPLVVADLSFISLRSVVPALAGPVAAPAADLVLLVKPQFEAGRAAVSRGKGVVRDPVALARCARRRSVRARRRRNRHHGSRWLPPSPAPPAMSEFLLHARKGVPGLRADEATALFAAAVSEAEGTCRRPPRPAESAPPMATVTFLVHPDRPDALALATDTAAWLTERGHAARILRFSGPDRVSEGGVEIDLAAVDLAGTTVAVSMGGDGTFLRVVRLAASRGRAGPRRQLRPPRLPARPCARPGPQAH